MAKAISLSDFIIRANEKHNHLYDYDSVVLLNIRTEVDIWCKKHKIMFTQLPKTHLLGKTGCCDCVKEKKEQTCLKNHGVLNPSQSVEIKEKKEETCLKNHGVNHSFQSKEIQEKSKQTCLKLYGVDNPNKSKIIRKKIIKTNNERYGVDTPFQNDAIKDKIKQTNMDNLGVPYPMQNESVREKAKQTNMDNLGVAYPMQNESVREKAKQTNMDNLGVPYSLQNESVREKAKKTNIKKYGTEHATQNASVKEKTKQTNIKKYGFSTPSQNEIIKNKIKAKNNLLFGVDYASQKHLSTDVLLKLQNKNWLIEQHHIYKKTLFEIANILGVTPKTVADNFKKLNIEVKRYSQSQMEHEIVTLIKENSEYEIVINSRNIITNEIDIFLPEIKLAIEVNGDYFHSELMGKDNKYHLNKLNECADKNINLLFAWEHDWIHSREVLSSLILSKINKIHNKVNARTCSVLEIDTATARTFLVKNHLHGYVNSSICVGLYHNNDLVSVMTFGKNRFGTKEEYEMSRFSSKIFTNVRGAAGKLFKFFINKYQPKGVVSYASLGLFTGTVYKHLGFEYSHTSKPNYKYFHKSNTSKMYSRVKFQKHKLAKQLDNFDVNLSEWENMKNNGYNRIWDCGNNIYVFKNIDK